MLFKVDIEKAYDKIKWLFVHKMSSLKGFPDRWNDWIMETMRGGHVGIKVNHVVDPPVVGADGRRGGAPPGSVA